MKNLIKTTLLILISVQVIAQNYTIMDNGTGVQITPGTIQSNRPNDAVADNFQ